MREATSSFSTIKVLPRPFSLIRFQTFCPERSTQRAINDKIVLIGVTAQSVKDFFFTPYSRGFSEAQQVPGVFLHGLMVSQLLRAGLEGVQPLATLTERNEILWIMLWCLLGGLTGLKAHSAWRFSLLGLAGVLLIGLSAYSPS